MQLVYQVQADAWLTISNIGNLCRNDFSAYLLLEKTNSSGGAAVPGLGPPGGSSGLTFSSVDAPVPAAGVAHRELISGLMHVDTGNGPDKWYR
jgi:hypothetical protein